MACLSAETKLLAILMHSLHLNFMDAYVHPLSGDTRRYHQAGTWSEGKTRIYILLAWQEVAPLFRNDLTSSQRLVQQMWLAKVLLHEIIHAYSCAIDIFNVSLPPEEWQAGNEPYFGDEQVSELGCSMENGFFGGVQEPFIDPQDVAGLAPRLGIFLTEWPNDNPHHERPILLDPPFSRWKVAVPIPVSYFEMIQSNDFWESHFRSFGSIKPGPAACAAIRDRNIPNNPYWNIVTNTQLSSILQNQTISPIAAMVNMTPDERALHANKLRTASIEKFYRCIDARNNTVHLLVDQGEICERHKGPPDYHIFETEMQRLLEAIRLMISRIVDCVDALKEVESGREKQVGRRTCYQ